MKAFFFASSLLAIPLSALAGEPPIDPTDPLVRLDPVGVAADREKPLTVPSLDESRTDLARTPGGTEVIDPTRFTKGRASTVNDIFALSAGVVAQSRFGSDEARLSIRGSGLQRTFHGRGLRILQDGVPLNLADGSFDMQAFEPLAASYVNVWRGANALAYGASTLGGAIDFVSRTGREGGQLLRVEAGSFGYLRAFAGGGFASGNTDIYAAVTRTELDGFRAHSRQRSVRLLANAGWRLSEQVETRFYLAYVTTNSELPGSLLKSEVVTIPRIANPTTAAQNQKRDFELLRGASKTTLRLASTVIDATLGWTYKDLDHPISPVVDQSSNDQLVALTATNVNQLGGQTNRLKAGLMWTRNRVNAANFVNIGGARGALTAQADNIARNTELWVEDQFSLTPSLTLIGGSSFARNQRRNEQELGGSGSYDRDYRNASPKIGLRWDAAAGVQLYANVSDSYEPPSFSETGALTAPNRAQKARTVEVGSRGALGPVRWDASLYSAKLRDEFLSLNDANGTPLGTINAPRTTHAGVELSFESDLLGRSWSAATPPAHRLVLRSAWTYGRFTFDDHPVYRDNTLAGFPPHTIRGELKWESARGWYAGPSFEWVPQRAPIDFANSFFADLYAIYGFRLGHRPERGAAWFAEVRNLADKHYAATTGVIADARGLDARQFLPGETRAFYAGIEYRW